MESKVKQGALAPHLAGDAPEAQARELLEAAQLIHENALRYVELKGNRKVLQLSSPARNSFQGAHVTHGCPCNEAKDIGSPLAAHLHGDLPRLGIKPLQDAVEKGGMQVADLLGPLQSGIVLTPPNGVNHKITAAVHGNVEPSSSVGLDTTRNCLWQCVKL